MIRETTKKLNLIPYRAVKGKKKDNDTPPYLNISPKYGRMLFSAKSIAIMGIEGKWVKLFYEPTKKIIAWQVEHSINQETMKDWKLCKVHSNGLWAVSIKKLIENLRIGSKDADYKRLEIRRYRELGMLVGPNSTYYYVEVKRKHTHEQK